MSSISESRCLERAVIRGKWHKHRRKSRQRFPYGGPSPSEQKSRRIARWPGRERHLFMYLPKQISFGLIIIRSESVHCTCDPKLNSRPVGPRNTRRVREFATSLPTLCLYTRAYAPGVRLAHVIASRTPASTCLGFPISSLSSYVGIMLASETDAPRKPFLSMSPTFVLPVVRRAGH